MQQMFSQLVWLAVIAVAVLAGVVAIRCVMKYERPFAPKGEKGSSALLEGKSEEIKRDPSAYASFVEMEPEMDNHNEREVLIRD